MVTTTPVQPLSLFIQDLDGQPEEVSQSQKPFEHLPVGHLGGEHHTGLHARPEP